MKGPSRDWLNVVKSTQAKNKINQWFKKEFKESNIIKGKEMVVSYCKAKSLNLSNLLQLKYEEIVQKKIWIQGLGFCSCIYWTWWLKRRTGRESSGGRVWATSQAGTDR